jgi:hypothetical protein
MMAGAFSVAKDGIGSARCHATPVAFRLQQCLLM